MTEFKLGKLPPKFDPRTFKLSAYFKAGLPPVPWFCGWHIKGRDWGYLGNDKYGDCAFAAVGHAEQCWTANSFKQLDVKEKDIIDAYFAYTGGEDRGSVLLDVLKIWRKQGIINKKIEAFVKVDRVEQVKSAIYMFGGVYIGLELPNYVMKSPIKTPWTRTAFAAPNSNNGHCVHVVGYDKNNLYCITWGQVKAMSYNFAKKYMDEAYVILSPDWFYEQKAPNGFDYRALQEDLGRV